MKGKLFIIYASLVQSITALFVIFSMPILVASLGYFYQVFPNHLTGAALMLFSGLLALFGLTRGNGKRFFYFLPQLSFLMLTAGSSLNSVLSGHYADGVIRPWQFIFVDQLPYFIGVIIYMFAIFNFKKDYEVD